MNKKHQKQLEVEKKKLTTLQQQLSGAKKQMDDPEDVIRLQKEIADCEARMKKLRESDA